VSTTTLPPKVHLHAACGSTSKLQNVYSRNLFCGATNALEVTGPLHTILIGDFLSYLKMLYLLQ
jgi:hypothetical protein